MFKLTSTPTIRRRHSGPVLGAMDPNCGSQCLSSLREDRLRNPGGGGEECSRGNLKRGAFDILFPPISNALVPSKTLLKGP